MKDWSLVYEGFIPSQQPLRETLCTLGNGYFATRGAASEHKADGIHYPGTYVAGAYNRLASEVAERTVVNEDLVNFPNWLPLTFRPSDGDWLTLLPERLLHYRQELNLRHGVLSRTLRTRDATGRETSVATRRIVHMESPHLAAIEYVITPENWSGEIIVRSLLDGSVINSGVARYRSLSSKHLDIVSLGEAGEEDSVFLVARTIQSRLETALAARTRVYLADEPVPASRRIVRTAETVGNETTFSVRAGVPVAVEKIVALHTSRDAASSEASIEARAAVLRGGRFADLLRSQERAWGALWRRCDMELVPANDEQLILRLHMFHLLQTVCHNTIGLDVGVPARGWHGEAYRGHIFWDELFVFPCFNLRMPEITRALLLYRFRRLGAARRLAKEAGHSGAMFPWQSASNGDEETQRLHLNPRSGKWGPDHSRHQRHVNAAVAFNVWQYHRVTGDREFLVHYGAEMLLDIARFLCSICHYDEASGRFEIHGVMGPDEYHEQYPDSNETGLRNNAYTNVMTVWVLERALEALEILPPESKAEVCERIGLTGDEINLWRQIVFGMKIPFHGDGIVSQFEGYERLAALDWDELRRKHGSIDRLDRILKAIGDSPNRYQASKQADVLMLFYLLSRRELRRIFRRLGYDLSDEVVRRTVDYYLARTTHGSSLSKVVHASVIDRFDRAAAWDLFRQALKSDVADVQGGTTPEGIHLGAMSGTVDIVLRHYAGVDTSSPVLSFHPRLPPGLDSLRLRLRHRGQWYKVGVERRRFRLEVDEHGLAPRPVRVYGVTHVLAPGSRFDCRIPASDLL
ncbi:MAG: glycoside hydrolase family 65 protein [Vicinamibacteria bacterium]|nr:glycoside hydrolase family 65 protein [Vicinamibacteria bacterium]